MTGTVVSGGRVGLLLLAGLCALTHELLGCAGAGARQGVIRSLADRGGETCESVRAQRQPMATQAGPHDLR